MVQGACHKHLVSVSPMNALACPLKPAKDFGLGRRNVLVHEVVGVNDGGWVLT